MALREFTDSTGCRWRVWDIRPEQMHAATRAEDHLQNVIHGWLAFEQASGGEKRRLSPIPGRWESLPEADLERLLERADPVRVEATPSRAESARPQAPTATASPVARTFRYPSGRYWTVNELPTASTSSESQRPLLQFTSGTRSLETRDWPSEWARLSDEDLAELLYRSFPRESTENTSGFRRRRGDIA
jgi:hypothetical protein